MKIRAKVGGKKSRVVCMCVCVWVCVYAYACVNHRVQTALYGFMCVQFMLQWPCLLQQGSNNITALLNHDSILISPTALFGFQVRS